MKFTVVSMLATVASAVSVSYDPVYAKSLPLTSLACSDGSNGLITKHGWHTLGQVPKFPYVGGFDGVAGWNSAQCGQCYELSYKGTKINVLAVDHAANGWNLTPEAMNKLTKNQAVQLGRVEATAKKVAVSKCGL